MSALGASSRLSWVMTILMATRDIAFAQDKVAATVHDLAVVGGSIVVGEIFGGTIGSFAGPIETGFGVVAGGVLGPGWSTISSMATAILRGRVSETLIKEPVTDPDTDPGRFAIAPAPAAVVVRKLLFDGRPVADVEGIDVVAHFAIEGVG